MYIKAIDMLPRYVDGKKFTEHTLIGKYKGYDLKCTTVYMNDKPLHKEWEIKGLNFVKNIWKSLKGSNMKYYY